ncbi:MAG: phage holin family protein [Burkholderiales bacterium]
MADRAPSSGLRDSLGRLAQAALALLRTRAELAALEFAEQREHAKQHLLLLAIAGAGFAMAWLAVCALIVAYFWDSHRLMALLVIAAAHLVVGIAALWRLDVRRRTDAPPFSATLAELERDREWLGKQFRDP